MGLRYNCLQPQTSQKAQLTFLILAILAYGSPCLFSNKKLYIKQPLYKYLCTKTRFLKPNLTKYQSEWTCGLLDNHMRIFFKIFLTIAFFFGTNVTALEEPQYEVVYLADGYEVRYYQDRLATEVSGAISADAAFRKLFKYISVANATSSKVEMTASVKQFVTIDTTFPKTTPPERYMQFY